MPAPATKPAKHTRSKSGGFSLIELLIVIAIILIIAAIAIPNFMRSRMAANEAAAVTSSRNIFTAQHAYWSTYNAGFADSLVKLAPPTGGGFPNQTAAGLIDEVLGAGTKSGYVFRLTITNIDALGRPVAFTVNSDPVTQGATGQRYFITDQGGIIRFSHTGPATINDLPIS